MHIICDSSFPGLVSVLYILGPKCGGDAAPQTLSGGTFGMRFLFTAAVFATILLGGCDFSETKNGNAATPPGQSLTEPTYKALQKDLFAGYCTGCHGATKHAGGVDLTSYSALSSGQTGKGKALLVPGQADASRVYAILAVGSMPPPGNPRPNAGLVSLLKDWIDAGATADLRLQGAPQPTSEPAPPPPTSGVATYASLTETLFKPMCVGCHNSEKSKGGVRLDSYDEMMKSGGDTPVIVPGEPDASKLLEEVAGGHMPPKRTNIVVPQGLKDNLHDWIAKGAPRD